MLGLPQLAARRSVAALCPRRSAARGVTRYPKAKVPFGHRVGRGILPRGHNLWDTGPHKRWGKLGQAQHLLGVLFS
ncbi:hypothetical protein [Dictyobacter formicarum]|uniref:hypothetical protein n=1 Tax=Dictyobacter formicarum TaxID=2778368 RepID=UPI001914E27D|nr:hypothetical protein [Dictyobacter formicarum]